MVLPSGDVIQYRYDAEGMRVKKVEGGSEVRYLMDGLRVVCEYDNNGNIMREYVPGISVKQKGMTYYYLTDRLGNVRYVLDENGAVVQSYLYTPFGEIHTQSGNLNQPYQYVGGEGYYTEETTGLQLLGQRWYDAEEGRFISRDPIGEEGLSLYTYLQNNPLNWVDPDGLKKKKKKKKDGSSIQISPELQKELQQKYKNCYRFFKKGGYGNCQDCCHDLYGGSLCVDIGSGLNSCYDTVCGKEEKKAMEMIKKIIEDRMKNEEECSKECK